MDRGGSLRQTAPLASSTDSASGLVNMGPSSVAARLRFSSASLLRNSTTSHSNAEPTPEPTVVAEALPDHQAQPKREQPLALAGSDGGGIIPLPASAAAMRTSFSSAMTVPAASGRQRTTTGSLPAAIKPQRTTGSSFSAARAVRPEAELPSSPRSPASTTGSSPSPWDIGSPAALRMEDHMLLTANQRYGSQRYGNAPAAAAATDLGNQRHVNAPAATAAAAGEEEAEMTVRVPPVTASESDSTTRLPLLHEGDFQENGMTDGEALLGGSGLHVDAKEASGLPGGTCAHVDAEAEEELELEMQRLEEELGLSPKRPGAAATVPSHLGGGMPNGGGDRGCGSEGARPPPIRTLMQSPRGSTPPVRPGSSSTKGPSSPPTSPRCSSGYDCDITATGAVGGPTATRRISKGVSSSCGSSHALVGTAGNYPRRGSGSVHHAAHVPPAAPASATATATTPGKGAGPRPASWQGGTVSSPVGGQQRGMGHPSEHSPPSPGGNGAGLSYTARLLSMRTRLLQASPLGGGGPSGAMVGGSPSRPQQQPGGGGGGGGGWGSATFPPVAPSPRVVLGPTGEEGAPVVGMGGGVRRDQLLEAERLAASVEASDNSAFVATWLGVAGGSHDDGREAMMRRREEAALALEEGEASFQHQLHHRGEEEEGEGGVSGRTQQQRGRGPLAGGGRSGGAARGLTAWLCCSASIRGDL